MAEKKSTPWQKCNNKCAIQHPHSQAAQKKRGKEKIFSLYQCVDVYTCKYKKLCDDACGHVYSHIGCALDKSWILIHSQEIKITPSS